MATYDAKNIQFVWRGVTLTGAAEYTYDIKQTGDSFKAYKGVAGEGLNIVKNDRMWTISRSFKVDSVSLPILIQDNLNNVEGTLVIRDLNTGITDTFSDCVIMSISDEKDSTSRIVVWNALNRNGR